MTEAPLTLPQELCRLGQSEKLGEALVRLGMLPEPDAEFELQIVDDWARSGAETYSLVFKVAQALKESKTYRLKACVAFSAGSSVEAILSAWLQRRRLLAEKGVSVPQLYGSGGGVILEEEIPFLMRTVLNGQVSETVLNGLLNIAAALVSLRFLPVNGFSDILSRGHDAVYLDFGSDLGEPGKDTSNADPIFDQLVVQLGQWSCELSKDQVHELRQAFEARLASAIQ